jgi:Domain of unknown function (DUF4326)
MSGKVVNMKHVANPADGSLPEGIVYVGRNQHWGKVFIRGNSKFENRYSVKRYGREGALRLYEERKLPKAEPYLSELVGRDLACWCPGQEEGIPDVLTLEDPIYCHAQILLRAIEERRAV